LKKILFIHHGEVPGGAPTSLANTIIALKKEMPEFEMIIWCMNKAMCNYFEDRCHVESVFMPNPLKETGKVMIGWTKLFQIKVLRNLLGEFRYIRGRINDFQQLIQTENPDFVHLNSGCLFVPAIAAKRLNIPILWHIREVFGGGMLNLRRIIVGKWLRSIAYRVFCISEIEAHSIGGSHSDNVSVVYNFVDFDTFKPNRSKDEINAELKIDKDIKKIITLGGSSFRKGLYELLLATNQLPEFVHVIIAGPELQKPDQSVSRFHKVKLKMESILYSLHLVPYLKIDYENRCRMAYQKIKNKSRVHFIGSKIDIVNYINACDILYFGGTMPHFPRPVFEAWLLNKPIIAFDELGVSNQIENGKNGFIMNKKNLTQLTTSINELISRDDLCLNFGLQGFKISQEKFDSKKNIKMISKYLQ